ncbi:MAG: response regulator transcription factor [Helicobacter sp.]|nr:response regulator transcription factor [Helicobacter sp.]
MLSELLEPLASLTLLVAEDDLSDLEMLKIPLERRCKRVLTCTKGEQGVKIFKEESVDIILINVNIKGKIDGITMASMIRKINPAVPIIFITAHSNEEKINEIIRLNAIALIKKKIDLETLFVILLGISKKIQKVQMVDLGHSIFYRTHDRCILKDYAVIELTDRESAILELLIDTKGHPVLYEEFKQHIWKQQKMTIDSLRMHINNLRKKTYYELIKNHSRLGYKLIINKAKRKR